MLIFFIKSKFFFMSHQEIFAYGRLVAFILVILLCVDAIYGEDLPLWWDTFVLTDWLVRKVFFGIRDRYRKIRAFIFRLKLRVLFIKKLIKKRVFFIKKFIKEDLPFRHTKIGLAYVRLLSKIYPHFVARSEERSDLYILYICVQPWRVYLICFLCLCRLWAKRFFSYWWEFFVFYRAKMFNNAFASFLFDRASCRPLGFLRFTALLFFFFFCCCLLFRAGFLVYTSFSALAIFFNITWSFPGDFFFALFSLCFLLLLLVVLELMGRLAFIIFLHVFRLPPGAFSFALFFPVSIFFFFSVF